MRKLNGRSRKITIFQHHLNELSQMPQILENTYILKEICPKMWFY